MRKSLKELPLCDRPREKMAALGAEVLTDAELIAILLGTGTAEKSALDIAFDMTNDGGLYKHLARITKINELTNIKGLGKAKAAAVLAALEIGRRIASANPIEKVALKNPQDVARFLMPRMRYAVKEHFTVLLLNTKNKIIGTETISEGTLTNSLVHPREVFKPALLKNAAAIIVAHNHPSGEPQPSSEDKKVTRILKQSGQILGIPLIDHLIIGDGIYYSFREHELI